MCLAIPGKIIEIEKDIATVSYGSETRKAKILKGDFKLGDFVIIQNKIVIEKVPEENFKAWAELLQNGT